MVPAAGSKREKQLEIRRALRGVRVPVDIVVSTPEEFHWRQEIVGTIEYPAVKDGKVLYARSPEVEDTPKLKVAILHPDTAWNGNGELRTTLAEWNV